MSANTTIIQQGTFVADGTNKVLNIRSDVDWMEVDNYTQLATQQTPGRGVQFRWQRGMAPATGIEIKKTDATDALNGVTMASGGFTLLDTSNQSPGPLVSTITAVSNATPPVVTTSAPHGLLANDVVRLINVASAHELNGYDFTVGNGTLTATTFSLDYMATIVAGTTGSFRKIPFQPQFYPRRRLISAITQATSAVIKMTVTHGFTAGQAVRIKVPKAFGMIEMNSLVGNITAINTTTNTITVDIDSSAFTAFAFPLSAASPFDLAEVIPVGETANGTFANNLADATVNTSIIGMLLGGGAQGPAGSASDVIYWRAGKSFSNSLT